VDQSNITQLVCTGAIALDGFDVVVVTYLVTGMGEVVENSVVPNGVVVDVILTIVGVSVDMTVVDVVSVGVVCGSGS